MTFIIVDFGLEFCCRLRSAAFSDCSVSVFVCCDKLTGAYSVYCSLKKRIAVHAIDERNMFCVFLKVSKTCFLFF